MSTQPTPPSGTPLEVDLPAGGKLYLQTPEEVDMWNESSKKYQADYRLTKSNDLVLLGIILTQNLAAFRAQMKINGMVPEFDQAGIPTGRFIKDPNSSSKDVAAAQNALIKAAEEIRSIEKALGIDKKTREAGGAFTVQDYIVTAKKAAHEFGVHITKRTKLYEAFVRELSWKVRLLNNGDPEDRQEHNLTEESVISWAEEEMKNLEEHDKKYANEIGKTFVGKL